MPYGTREWVGVALLHKNWRGEREKTVCGEAEDKD